MHAYQYTCAWPHSWACEERETCADSVLSCAAQVPVSQRQRPCHYPLRRLRRARKLAVSIPEPQACTCVAAERAACVHVRVVESVVALYVCVCSESAFLEYARLVTSCAEMCIIGICSNANCILASFFAFSRIRSRSLSCTIRVICISRYTCNIYIYPLNITCTYS